MQWHLGCTDDAPPVNAYGFDDSSTYVSDPAKNTQLGNFSDRWFPANSSRLIADLAIDFMSARVRVRVRMSARVRVRVRVRVRMSVEVKGEGEGEDAAFGLNLDLWF